MKRLLIATLLAGPVLAHADEGMWTFNAFPKAAVEKAYGFKVTDAWLDHVRLSSARLAQGCSASFVSERGLVMTNHHCAHSCIEQLSTRERDYVRSGFLAATDAAEVKCPQLEVNQLVGISDVTARMKKATAGKSGREFFQAQRAEQAAIEKACQTTETLRCEVVSLYRGGVYDLYTYQRYQDVRLVFAPEFAIAFFGGDPDNFTFPRWDLDVAFLRVYQGGQPARMKDWLRWSAAGAKDGDLTFVSGNPGGTDRALTVAQLEYQRDTVLPERMVTLAELRGRLGEYTQRGAEQARHANAKLFYVENSLKALTGRLEALQDKAFFASKVKAEADFKAALARDPEKARLYLPAYDQIAEAVSQERRLRRQLEFKERLDGGDLLSRARLLARAATERAKPNANRLREYTDAALPQTHPVALLAGAHLPRVRGLPAHLPVLEDAREARARRPLREEGAGPQGARRAGRRAGPRHRAGRSGHPQEDLGRRAGGAGGGGAQRHHAGLRQGHRRGRPRRPRPVRLRRPAGPGEEPGADRAGPLRPGGDQRLPRRHLHPAPLLRHGARLRGGRRARWRPSPPWAAPSSAPPAASPSPCRSAGSTPGRSSTWPRPSTWSPPTTSSAATPARR